MLRRFHSHFSKNFVRCVASYDSAPLSHNSLSKKYAKSAPKNGNVLELLESTENNIYNWKLNKWELRVPHLIAPIEKEKYQLQMDLLKSQFLHRKKEFQQIRSDISLICNIAGIDEASLHEKNRQWLQETTASLRWKGDINNAKGLRDAFIRLEANGSRNHELLERMCGVYGLGLLGTFEDAFSNLIVEDPHSQKCAVLNQNHFSELLGEIVTKYPEIDIIYDFLGFNVSGGYRSSLSRFFKNLFVKKNAESEYVSSGRLIYHNPSQKELLFDFCNSSNISTEDSIYGLPDFFVMRGNDIYLLTIASENHWLRSRQIPHDKQVEGMARRSCFVFGLNYDDVRVKRVLLPPNYVDRSSLLRLGEIVGVEPTQMKTIVPWLDLYTKELNHNDVDFCDIAKTVNNEEWLKL